MTDKKPENLKRRGFLLAAGVGGAGAVAVAVGVGKEKTAPVATVKPEDKVGSYEETRHVSNYYRTARV
ncbi:formate dehydrogenase [Dechloromonas sp. H13]|uniref:formate dehydrogenase n=1 Tax=Dechloromonas sp. H13 TaxID=2570193 RepID=UPI00129187CF|nr:formate dehydrogenase [Dechloromonas sp. H13]